jgi:hypothetical protein
MQNAFEMHCFTFSQCDSGWGHTQLSQPTSNTSFQKGGAGCLCHDTSSAEVALLIQFFSELDNKVQLLNTQGRLNCTDPELQGS